MAEPDHHSSSPSINPQNGFCSKTKIYHSLRPPSPLPPETSPFSFTDYVFSLQSNSSATNASLIDAATRRLIPHSHIPLLVTNLAAFLRQPPLSLSHGDCAFVISPNSVHLPILYLSLFSIGVVVSPTNPSSSVQEISRQIHLSKPVVAFASVDSAHKLLKAGFKSPIIRLNSAELESILNGEGKRIEMKTGDKAKVSQSDTAAILYSSGTTGRIKGVKLMHRNLICTIAGALAGRLVRSSPAVCLVIVPYFHVYGFVLCIRLIAFGDSIVSMERFDLRLMMRTIEELRVTHLALAPPLVVALVNSRNDGLVGGCDCSSLETVLCGGAQLTVAAIEKFKTRFPNVTLLQAYGMTELCGGVTRIAGPYESTIVGTVGRLIAHCEAKIVDPETGVGLPSMKPGELWVRGPFIMKGYVNDKEATDTMVDKEGWLRTGDLCYFDNEGFLFYVDRLKELIKYKGYQVPPAELEHILQSHPDIVEAAVIPYPDEEAGQVPMAFVVKRTGSTIDETQIKDFVAKQVAPYKKLRLVSFINSIPKNAPGKVLRKELVKLALSDISVTSKL